MARFGDQAPERRCISWRRTLWRAGAGGWAPAHALGPLTRQTRRCRRRCRPRPPGTPGRRSSRRWRPSTPRRRWRSCASRERGRSLGGQPVLDSLRQPSSKGNSSAGGLQVGCGGRGDAQLGRAAGETRMNSRGRGAAHAVDAVAAVQAGQAVAAVGVSDHAGTLSGLAAARQVGCWCGGQEAAVRPW